MSLVDLILRLKQHPNMQSVLRNGAVRDLLQSITEEAAELEETPKPSVQSPPKKSARVMTGSKEKKTS